MQIQISWLLLQKPTGLDLHSLHRQGISGFSRTRVNKRNNFCDFPVRFAAYRPRPKKGLKGSYYPCLNFRGTNDVHVEVRLYNEKRFSSPTLRIPSMYIVSFSTLPSKHTVSQQRRYNVVTLQRRCRDIVCLLGVY